MKNSILWIVIGIVVLLGLGWWLMSMKSAPEPVGETPNPSEVKGEDTADASKDAAVDASIEVSAGADVETVTVSYTAEGFSPKMLTVKKGTKVVFVDKGGGNMWVGSDEHPSHTGYAGTSREEHCSGGAPSTTAFDQCGTGTSYTFTFDTVGTWDYHNHRAAGDRGTVTVTE